MIEQLLASVTSAGGEGPPGVEFLGEQSVTGFINGLELADQIGLEAGTAQHTDSPWLHFELDGKTLYVAKCTYRHTVSWDHINAAGAVFGTKTVEINDKVYKVRLLKSVASGNIYTGSSTYDPIQAYGSEWNRLFYPIHSGKHTDTKNPSPVSGEGIRFGTLAQYTDTDLLLYYTAGSGSRSWCQETPSSDTTRRVGRGIFGVSHLDWYAASLVSSAIGWRPVLELVE